MKRVQKGRGGYRMDEYGYTQKGRDKYRGDEADTGGTRRQRKDETDIDRVGTRRIWEEYDVCRMDETDVGWTRLIYSKKDEKIIRGQICKMKKQIKYG